MVLAVRPARLRARASSHSLRSTQIAYFSNSTRSIRPLTGEPTLGREKIRQDLPDQSLVQGRRHRPSTRFNLIDKKLFQPWNSTSTRNSRPGSVPSCQTGGAVRVSRNQ